MDIANFYLNTPMERYEYMSIPFQFIPNCIKTKYNLQKNNKRVKYTSKFKVECMDYPNHRNWHMYNCEKFGQGRVLPIQVHSRVVEAPVEAHHIHLNCGRLWSSICWAKQFQPLTHSITKELYEGHSGLDRNHILCNATNVGLPWT